jgi:hypothetical protein
VTFTISRDTGYSHVGATRPTRSGGGVSLHIKSSLEYRTRPDLHSFNDINESLFIELSNDNVIIGAIYRPL